MNPSPVHTIRLGPPWELTATAAGMRHVRKFGRPRTLEANERLWLVCGRVPSPAVVYVNGTVVGSSGDPGPFAAEITPLLLVRNEVEFSVASKESLGGVVLEVRAD